ncbi:hypothetical protein PtB15_13B432 [Puccinia triticina]|nr:hypothetical protein PtB15_13B432 [Puccinia triticina]
MAQDPLGLEQLRGGAQAQGAVFGVLAGQGGFVLVCAPQQLRERLRLEDPPSRSTSSQRLVLLAYQSRANRRWMS